MGFELAEVNNRIDLSKPGSIWEGLRLCRFRKADFCRGEIIVEPCAEALGFAHPANIIEMMMAARVLSGVGGGKAAGSVFRGSAAAGSAHTTSTATGFASGFANPV